MSKFLAAQRKFNMLNNLEVNMNKTKKTDYNSKSNHQDGKKLFINNNIKNFN